MGSKIALGQVKISSAYAAAHHLDPDLPRPGGDNRPRDFNQRPVVDRPGPHHRPASHPRRHDREIRSDLPGQDRGARRPATPGSSCSRRPAAGEYGGSQRAKYPPDPGGGTTKGGNGRHWPRSRSRRLGPADGQWPGTTRLARCEVDPPCAGPTVGQDIDGVGSEFHRLADRGIGGQSPRRPMSARRSRPAGTRRGWRSSPTAPRWRRRSTTSLPCRSPDRWP